MRNLIFKPRFSFWELCLISVAGTAFTSGFIWEGIIVLVCAAFIQSVGEPR